MSTVKCILEEITESIPGIEWTTDTSFLVNGVSVEIISDEEGFFSCFELYVLGDDYVEVFISSAESVPELCLMVLSD
jgi:hypothetical protein